MQFCEHIVMNDNQEIVYYCVFVFIAKNAIKTIEQNVNFVYLLCGRSFQTETINN